MVVKDRLVITGGGTGGHLFPLLSVASSWQGKVLYIGSRRGLESRIEIPFESYLTRAKPFIGKSIFYKFYSTLYFLFEAFAVLPRIAKFSPSVVLSSGGYVSIPALIASIILRIPIVLFEPNTSLGAANKFFTRFAYFVCLGFQNLEVMGRKFVFTGIPVRREFFELQMEQIVKPKLRVLVLGGSQGAMELNYHIPEVFVTLNSLFTDFYVVHQAGIGKKDFTLGRYAAIEDKVEVVEFLYGNIAKRYKWANLIVSRSGAVTLAEIAAVGRASLLVPLKIAQGHQVDNAKLFVNSGASLMYTDLVAEKEKMLKEIIDLASSVRKLKEMGEKAQALAVDDSNERIIEVLKRAAHGK